MFYLPYYYYWYHFGSFFFMNNDIKLLLLNYCRIIVDQFLTNLFYFTQQ